MLLKFKRESKSLNGTHTYNEFKYLNKISYSIYSHLRFSLIFIPLHSSETLDTYVYQNINDVKCISSFQQFITQESWNQNKWKVLIVVRIV